MAQKRAADSGAKQQPCEGDGSLQGHASHCLEQKGEGMRGEREQDLDCKQLSCHLRMLVVPREVGRLE